VDVIDSERCRIAGFDVEALGLLPGSWLIFVIY
jgi:hypothetical protein